MLKPTAAAVCIKARMGARLGPASIMVCTNSFGLFKSTNGGASWNEIGGAASGSIQYVAIDSTNANVIYGGGDGIFKSTDGGASWETLNEGLTSRSISALAIDRSGRFLHAGTQVGVFDIQLSATATPTPTPTPTPTATPSPTPTP